MKEAKSADTLNDVISGRNEPLYRLLPFADRTELLCQKLI
jgi:hypothetical protein